MNLDLPKNLKISFQKIKVCPFTYTKFHKKVTKNLNELL